MLGIPAFPDFKCALPLASTCPFTTLTLPFMLFMLFKKTLSRF